MPCCYTCAKSTSRATDSWNLSFVRDASSNLIQYMHDRACATLLGVDIRASRGSVGLALYQSNTSQNDEKEEEFKYPRLQVLPSNISMREFVYAITAFKQHTSCRAAFEEAVQANDDSSTRGTSSAPSSASTLQHAVKKANRSLMSKQLAALLRTRYEAAGSSWTLSQMQAEVCLIDPGAAKIAPRVMRLLKGECDLPVAAEMELVQGFALCLIRRGFHVILHVADAKAVRAQVRTICKFAQ